MILSIPLILTPKTNLSPPPAGWGSAARSPWRGSSARPWPAVPPRRYPQTQPRRPVLFVVPDPPKNGENGESHRKSSGRCTFKLLCSVVVLQSGQQPHDSYWRPSGGVHLRGGCLSTHNSFRIVRAAQIFTPEYYPRPHKSVLSFDLVEMDTFHLADVIFFQGALR